MKDGLYWVQQLKEQKVSRTELLKDIEKKVQKLNPKINGFVTFDSQKAEATYQKNKQQDTLFAGLPFPLKMLGQEKAGWSATAGSQLFKNSTATTTSNFVKQAETIGLMPLGQTNAPEFGFKNITDPALYGPARNPWNLEHSPGGSSGGAAAVVASGIVPIAGASDGGGSIRIPASFSGLIGLKPSRGSMPVGPEGWRGWQGASIDFALTISMRDTKALFYGLRGSHSGAPYQAPLAEWQTHTKKQRLKIALCTASPIGSRISPEATQAAKQAADFLAAAGHEIIEIPYPVDGAALIRSYYQMNGAETTAMMNSIQQGLGRPIRKEEIEPFSWTMHQFGQKIPAATYVHSLQLWDQAAVTMEELFQKFDLFLSPTTAFSAPKINEDLQSEHIRQRMEQAAELTEAELAELIYDYFDKSLQLTPYTQLANLTGQPAISLPTHVTATGLPLGIQLLAARGREDLLFQVGEQFEQEGKFKLPESYR
ncbi:amidase [Enterococcus faecalis]|uniref:amidase n=1 Tax=Enterococcus TaxID=1350 RepID=UPI0009C1055C|nr:amidase [Enterococcus faecalis]EGO2712011.1 amidase [Enterococcus faecalis]EGO7800537.1 amidase [Enterococcus faecalis]EGO7832972.1 amidase [Enterococcus faecalis]EGO8121355.1 amidase [Enterococcus faecalis]EGO8491929.1 amidase [Enterococcus faecalis]